MRRALVLLLLVISAAAPAATFAAESEPNDSCVEADRAEAWEYATLGGSDTQDWWFIDAAYGDRLFVQMNAGYQPTSNFDLELYTPGCTLVAGQYRQGSEVETITDVATTAGPYRARVIYNSGAAGTYSLNFTASPNEHECSDTALVTAAVREQDLTDVSCTLPPMGDITVRVTLTITSMVAGAPAGLVEGALDESTVRCGPEVGGCIASGVVPGGFGRTCRTLLLTTGAGVTLHCAARPEAP